MAPTAAGCVYFALALTVRGTGPRQPTILLPSVGKTGSHDEEKKRGQPGNVRNATK